MLLDTIGLKPLAIFGIAVMTYATWELTKLNMDTPYMTISGHLCTTFIWYGIYYDANGNSSY